MRKHYIVYAPAFSENSGGSLFLHYLTHTLNTLGEKAFVWPMLPLNDNSLRRRFERMIWPENYTRSPELDTPIAERHDLNDNAIVVYPEIALGNPLKAKNVVRWLLYKPGLRHNYRFGEDEFFFRVGEVSDLPEITGGAQDLTMWRINRTYRNENRPDRKGVAFITRKGQGKPRLPETDTKDAISIEKTSGVMSHAETNDVFNQVETFISYDEATFYSQYAAICGCISIVVPGLYENRHEWVRNHSLAKYGVAYGLNDTDHAIATRHLVKPMLEKKEQESIESVKNFIALTQERFR